MELIIRSQAKEEIIDRLNHIAEQLREGYTSGYDGDVSWDLKE